MQRKRSAVAALAVAMTTTCEQVRRASARAVDPLDIGLLKRAAQRGAVRPTEVAEHLDINPSSVTRHARVLVKSGQLTVSADPADGRASLIRLTDAGRARLQEIFEDGVSGYFVLLESWSAQDITAFTSYLDRFEGALQAAHETTRSADHIQSPGATCVQQPDRGDDGRSTYAGQSQDRIRSFRGRGQRQPAAKKFKIA